MKKLIKLFVFTVLCLFVGNSANIAFAKSSTPCYITSVKASHILVESKDQADDLKSKIDNGASFEALAQRYSKCPSGQNGGDLGYFERGQMVREFEEAAFSLPVGQVSEPVQTQFGWHLIKVYDRR